jgi:hypothetical protein
MAVTSSSTGLDVTLQPLSVSLAGTEVNKTILKVFLSDKLKTDEHEQ